jgi:glutathione synthase
MRFLYVMDPIDRINRFKDTTFAFLRATQNLGFESVVCHPRDLYVDRGEAFARVTPCTVHDADPHFSLAEPQDLPLRSLHAVFMRKDPPFDSAYLYASQLLERARGEVVLVNDPRGLRDANEKLYALHFAEFTPRTLVTASPDRIHAFVKEIGGEAVIKPLDGAGGAGVLKLATADKNARSIVDMLTGEGSRYAMVQEFLPRVVEGDKRVLLLEGKILGAINRIPRGDDLRSNIHVGGRVEPCTLTAHEQHIVASIAPRLVRDGLFFVGLDMVGEKLTEVNVTSPTGIQELSQHLGRDVAEDVVRWAAERSASKNS